MNKLSRAASHSASSIVINGERLEMSELAAYVLADDITRASSLSEEISDIPPEDDPRFARFRDLLFELERVGGHGRALAWLVAPNETLAFERPLELLARGRWEPVVAVVPKTVEQFPSIK